MNRQQQIMIRLKPKMKAFGFNHKELKGLAAKIAENLESDENASDEDVNAEIDNAIEAVLPYLEVGRSYANRVINNVKNAPVKNEDEDSDEDDDESDDDTAQSSKSTKTRSKKSDEVPSWAKQLIDDNKTLRSELSALKGEKVTDSRRAKLEKILKDTGNFGARTLKSFGRMKFENDEEFDEFCADVEEDLKTYNQERANAGLEKLGAPATGGAAGKGQDNKPEVLSAEEIKAIASL